MIDLNEMAVFARVVAQGSFTRAAQSLGMPKSTVSERVNQLEGRLGVRLLERSTRALRLTPAGLAYYERCAKLVAEAEDADASVGDLQRSPKGLLRIGSPHVFARIFLAKLAGEFALTYPEVEVELVVADRNFDLIEEGLDIAVLMGNPLSPTIVSRKIGSAERVCCASPEYLQVHGTPRSPKDLTAHRWVQLGSERHPKRAFERDGRQMTVELPSQFRVHSLDLLIEAVHQGLGLALLPSFFINDSIRAGKLARVLEKWNAGQDDARIAFPDSRKSSLKVRLFVDLLLGRIEAGRAAERKVSQE